MSEKIINKIRNLFAHAESAAKIGSQAEAEAFAAHAHELLLKHKLDMATIERSALDLEDPMETRYEAAGGWGQRERQRREDWSEQLASVVVKAHFCRMAVNLSSNTLNFFGRRSDIEVAIFVFTCLARTSARLAREEMRTEKANYRKVKGRVRFTALGWRNTKTTYRHRVTKRLWPGDRRFLDSFHEGFRLAIRVRYQEQREAADADDKTALVLRRSDADAAAYAEEHVAPARSLKRLRAHEQARGLGWMHGQEADLDLKGLQPTRKAAGLLNEGSEP